MSKEESVRKFTQSNNFNNNSNGSIHSQTNSPSTSNNNNQAHHIFGNNNINNSNHSTSKKEPSILKEDYFMSSTTLQKPGQSDDDQSSVPRFREEDLSDLPSDELSDLQLDHNRTQSITSMDSYTSSGFPFMPRRESTFSSAPSGASPPSPGLDSSQYSYYHNMGAGSQTSFEQTPSSLSETAALAHLTSQQLDEMMSLVITMVRRLDRLEDRITNLSPDALPQGKPKDDGSEKEGSFSWWTSLAFIAMPILFGVAFKYITSGKGNKRRYVS